MNTGPVEDRLVYASWLKSLRPAPCASTPTPGVKPGRKKLHGVCSPWTNRRKASKKVIEAFREKLAYVEFMSMISFPAELVVEGDRPTVNATVGN